MEQEGGNAAMSVVPTSSSQQLAEEEGDAQGDDDEPTETYYAPSQYVTSYTVPPPAPIPAPYMSESFPRLI
jgi:hypothetical protein